MWSYNIKKLGTSQEWENMDGHMTQKGGRLYKGKPELLNEYVIIMKR